MTTELTAALGKRTKFQLNDIAQLYLRANSQVAKLEDATVPHSNNTNSNNSSSNSGVKAILPKKGGIVNNQDSDSEDDHGDGNVGETKTDSVENNDASAAAASTTGNSSESSSWVHAQWELGRRLVGATKDGEEAAVREVLLGEESLLLQFVAII